MAPGRTPEHPSRTSPPGPSRGPERGPQRAPPAGQVPARHRPLTGPTHEKQAKSPHTQMSIPKKNPVGKRGKTRNHARKTNAKNQTNNPKVSMPQPGKSTAPGDQSGHRACRHCPGPPMQGSSASAWFHVTLPAGSQVRLPGSNGPRGSERHTHLPARSTRVCVEVERSCG